MPKIARSEPWQHRFVEASGLRFHVVTQGPAGRGGSRGLVVLLHGFPEFWYSWRRQIPALAAAGFHVAAPDLRGSNESDKPEAIAKPGALQSTLNWYRAAFQGGLPSAREFPKIAAPTLIVWGEGDVFLGKELTRGMRAYFSGPFSLKYLPGVSHWVQQEAPAKVNALLTRFLAGSARR
jgi:pimeloyl-ACP methyl ester carboxylesterase